MLAIAFAAFLTAPASAADIRISRTTGATCRSVAELELRQTTCAGPAEYIAVISDRNRVMTISFSHPSTAPVDDEFENFDLLWRGMAPFIGDKIEWRLLAGKPFAAIVRIYTFAADDLPLQQFLVAKVTPAGGCEIARVDAADKHAYRTARDLADSQASNVTCELR